MHFDIPTERCLVIKTEFQKLHLEISLQKGDPIKLIFQPTPWRGLNVILAAMQMIQNPLITLDVYSSTEIYGDQFKQANNQQFEGLFEQAKKLSNVNYIGYKSNEYIVDQLKTIIFLPILVSLKRPLASRRSKLCRQDSIVLLPIMELYMKRVQNMRPIFLIKNRMQI